jgi:hypothetical protein
MQPSNLDHMMANGAGEAIGPNQFDGALVILKCGGSCAQMDSYRGEKMVKEDGFQGTLKESRYFTTGGM